jgi:hypothetical protein
VSELFDEVDEDLRREQIRKIWQRFGGLFIALAVLIVVGVGGWRAYTYYETKKASEAGAAFEAAVALADQNKHAEAEAAFAKIATGDSAPYRKLARFRVAGEVVERDKAEAVKLYDAIVADAAFNQDEKDLAQLRASGLLVDTAGYEDLQKRLEPLTTAKRTYRHSAREYLALSAWRSGNIGAAKTWVDAVAVDPETPQSIRTRVESLKALLPDTAKG